MLMGTGSGHEGMRPVKERRVPGLAMSLRIRKRKGGNSLGGRAEGETCSSPLSRVEEEYKKNAEGNTKRRRMRDDVERLVWMVGKSRLFRSRGRGRRR